MNGKELLEFVSGGPGEETERLTISGPAAAWWTVLENLLMQLTEGCDSAFRIVLEGGFRRVPDSDEFCLDMREAEAGEESDEAEYVQRTVMLVVERGEGLVGFAQAVVSDLRHWSDSDEIVVSLAGTMRTHAV